MINKKIIYKNNKSNDVVNFKSNLNKKEDCFCVKCKNCNSIDFLFNNKKIMIFDLDGTIADTETFHWKAYNQLLKNKFNIELSMDNISRYIGNAEINIYSMIKKDYNIDFDDQEFLNERLKFTNLMFL